MAESAEFGMVMPFIACKSQGGPFDDVAFVAGYQAGMVDQALMSAAAATATEVVFCVNTELRGQLELIGMKNGFPVMRAEVWDEAPDWTYYTFRRSDPAKQPSAGEGR